MSRWHLGLAILLAIEVFTGGCVSSPALSGRHEFTNPGAKIWCRLHKDKCK